MLGRLVSSQLPQAMKVAGITAMSTTVAMSTAKDPAQSESSGQTRLDMWKVKWEQGATRFHKPVVNPNLVDFFDELIGANTSARVLVPLCGKSVDLKYLADHRFVKDVVGVEGVRKALEEFAEEHPTMKVAESAARGPFALWEAPKLSLLQGDFFQLDSKVTKGQVDAVWDRAALVAVEPSMRETYVETLGRCLAPRGRILLATYVRYSGDTTKGPPYSIDEEEVRRLFASQPWVESVRVIDVHKASKHEGWVASVFMWMLFGKLDEKIFVIQAK